GGIGEGDVGAVGKGGEVLGATSDGERERSFIWSDGALRYVGGLFISNVSSASAINARGQVVGGAMAGEYAGSEIPHAFIWENGTIRDLGLLGDSPCPDSNRSCGYAFALDINADGAAAGVSSDASGAAHAVVWVSGTIHDLGQ